MAISATVTNDAAIGRHIKTVARRLAPDVVRIRYNLDLDWSGDEAIFFRVVLSDDASREDRLSDVTERIEAQVSRQLKLAESGLLSYFSFRSQSEQEELKEPAWY